MPRNSKRKSARKDKALGAVLTMVGAILIAALVGAVWWVGQRVPLDPETNCPREGPNSVQLVLIDQSDPVTGLQAQRVRQEITRLKATALPGTRFDIFSFEGDTSNELRPLLSICVPNRPEQASDWTENRERIRRRYEQRFSEVLDRSIEQLLRASTRPSSPIVESLRAAAQTSFGLLEMGRIPLHVTLVSDMVQHTADLSHFRSEPDFAQLARNPKWPLLRPLLKGAEVRILYLLRPTALRNSRPIQNAGHQLFWERLMAESGGRLTYVEPI